MIGVAMPGGRSLVYCTDGAGLLRRGRGRGVVLRRLPPWRRAKADDLAAAVDAVEVSDDWTDAPRAIAAWLRAGSRWGLVDGAAFDRSLARSAMRRHRWRGTGEYAVVDHNYGSCLVLRGRRGSRFLLMSGAVTSRECTGPELVGGVLS